MMFHLHRHGDGIAGWLTPDNPSATPRVIVTDTNGTSVEVVANFKRPDLVEGGLHHTGLVGFNINDQTVPGISARIDHVEVRDAESGILLYRPLRAQHLPHRLFRFDMHAMPAVRLEAEWNDAFQFYYGAAERFPFETMHYISVNPASQSVALAGRLSLTRYEAHFRAHDYKIVALLRDPVEEFVERILFLKHIQVADKQKEFRNHLTNLSALAAAVRRLDVSNPETFKEAFSYLTDKQLDELSNPLTTTLACRVDEVARADHVELALATLSRMDLVGVRSNVADFNDSLRTLLNSDRIGETAPPEVEGVKKLADELRGMKLVKSLLGQDIRLYDLVERAVETAIANRLSGGTSELDLMEEIGANTQIHA